MAACVTCDNLLNGGCPARERGRCFDPQAWPDRVVGSVSDERTRLMAASPNIVLVHGAWADGSCWSGVIERILTAAKAVASA